MQKKMSKNDNEKVLKNDEICLKMKSMKAEKIKTKDLNKNVKFLTFFLLNQNIFLNERFFNRNFLKIFISMPKNNSSFF